MAGWTTDIDWSNEDSIVNAPLGLVVADLAAATGERRAVLGVDPATARYDTNAPAALGRLRNEMVLAVGGGASGSYVKPNSSGDYDYHNESTVPRWSMAEMAVELGRPEPEFYAPGAPPTASWVKWWYDALNLLTHAGFTLYNPQKSDRIAEGVTFPEAVTNWNGTPWSAWSGGDFTGLRAEHRNPVYYPEPYKITRWRMRQNPAYPFSPGIYTKNYILLAVWAQITFYPAFTYVNNDYPCDRSKYAQVWSDTSVQSGEYDKTITIGDIDSVTVTAPADNSMSGWLQDGYFPLCQFDIEGGFEYVAPEE